MTRADEQARLAGDSWARQACAALRSIWPAAAALVLIVTGCATGLKTSELSELPIAFVYRTEAEARRRAERIADGQVPEYDPRSRTENRGVVNFNEFKNYLDNVFGQKTDLKHRGRLALLDARSLEVDVVQGSQPGALPQDWSSDHRRLLFVQGDPGARQLFEFDRNTNDVSQVTHGPDAHVQGCYTSEGRLVVSVQSLERSQAGDRYTSRIALREPSGLIEIISSGPSDGSPACSSDGRQFAFVRVFGNEPQIWSQALAPGSAARPVTPGYDPTFSSDGQWIVFTRGRETSKLWRIRVDGVGRTRLGTGSGTDEYRPVISPDGRFIVYESVLEYRSRLFLRRFDGTGDAVLYSTGDGMHAVW